jgi:hypothetical protein
MAGHDKHDKHHGKQSEKRSPGGSERRAHPRASCNGSITLQLQDGAHQARLRDVSRAGISFYLDRPVAEMTILSVRIDLPGRSKAEPARIDGRGVVVRPADRARGRHANRAVPNR